MHRRSILDWRSASLALVCASLALLPVAGAFAATRPEAVVEQPGGNGFGPTVGEENTLRPTTYARSNYAWPFANGPYYGDVNPQDRRSSGVLVTPVGSFYLADGGTLPFPAQLQAANKLAQGQAGQYFIVQQDLAAFNDPASHQQLIDVLEASGGRVMGPLPVAAWVALLTPEAHAAVSARQDVVAVEPYHAAFKLHPAIGRMPLTDAAAAVSTVYDLDVVLFAGEDAGLVAGKIAEIGGNVSGVWPDTVRVQISRELLPAIAGLEPVQMVFEHYPMFGHGHESAAALEIGHWDAAAAGTRLDLISLPYRASGIDGSKGGAAGTSNPGATSQDPGVIMVLDSGISVDGGDFSQTFADDGQVAPGIGVGHRKLLLYQATNVFGGSGDTQSCDSPTSGGSSHGNIVAATAAGHATDFSNAYGEGTPNPYIGVDTNQGQWSINGLAPMAKVVMYDGRVTPPTLPCAATPGISPGNLYGPGPNDGSLGVSYEEWGARVTNFSWGSPSNTYGGNAVDIDQFLFDKKDAMVFVSAGNSGGDTDGNGFPDEGTIGTPATTKNGLAIGATGTANDLGAGGDEDDRAGFTSAGPAVGDRVAPQLMAPGTDFGTMGLGSEFACTSRDNAQTNPVQCDVVEGLSGTSFASPAAAGAALLVRHYFAGGFYPDGTDNNPGNGSDVVDSISGSLLKSVLIASADWVGEGNADPGGPSSRLFRFNNEQGYGRIQLNNALPLRDDYSVGPVGLIVADGDVPGNPLNIPGLSGLASGTPGPTNFEQGEFTVCDPTQEIRVALSWIEETGSTLLHDLDLEVEAPDGTLYYGNYFTDDNNRDRALQAGEDCPDIDGTPGLYSATTWSLPVCPNSIRDADNPTEAVFLSPDADQDGDDDPDYNQIQPGTWTVRVYYRANSGGAASQPYSVAVAGGVCIGSSVRLVRNQYNCNGLPSIVVNETDETDDPATGLTPGEIGSRTMVEVIDPGADGVLGGGDDTQIDFETGLTFTQPDPNALRFELTTPLVMTDATAPDPGNGALDVAGGYLIKVTYQDESTLIPGPDPDQVRTSSARVDCDPDVQFGNLIFLQFGTDAPVFLEGGCERNARGNQEFGFPDRYADEDEQIGLRFAFTLGDQQDFDDVEASLRCVAVDNDSPSTCKPGDAPSGACTDPNRTNNPDCASWLTILDSPKLIGDIPQNGTIAAHFNIQMAGGGAVPDKQQVEFLLGIKSLVAGKTQEGLAVTRQTLDVDEFEIFYSTDFPTGGTEELDWNNDEVLDNPTTDLGDFLKDYRFETRTWSNLTQCTDAGGNPVTCNTILQNMAPWDFDGNNGGFAVGRGAISDVVPDIVANFGEDINFDGVLQAADEDRDPVNGSLDDNWSEQGGCGWQTNGTSPPTQGTPGGIWRTGGIRAPGQNNCLVSGGTNGDCQSFEILTGNQAEKGVFDILLTPEFEKVNKTLDANGDPVYEVRFLNWEWNAAVDMPDSLALVTMEFDTDTLTSEPVNLTADGSVLNLFTGDYGAVTGGGNPGLSDGYPMFAPLNAQRTNSQNTTVGSGVRVGDNGCYFESGAVSDADYNNAGFALPEHDGIDNDGDAVTDEYVVENGPLRNIDMEDWNGPDMRFTTFEDLYGASGETFQGALGFFVVEGDTSTQPISGFGMGVDDMVVKWKEVRLDPDTTVCSGGQCAVVELQTTNYYEGNSLLQVSVLELTPDPVQNCNLDKVCEDGTTPCTLQADCSGIGGGTCNPDFTDGDGGTCNQATNTCTLDGARSCEVDEDCKPDVADCNGDGTVDLPLKARCDTVPFDEEIFYVNQDTPSQFWRGTLPISSVYNTPGTLFCIRNGNDFPTVSVSYADNDDGTGAKCSNDIDPDNEGNVEVGTVVSFPVGLVSVSGYALTDDGDNDGICDAGERCNMTLEVNNQTGVDIAGFTVRLASNDPDVDCIINPVVSVANLPADTITTLPSDFVFRIANSVDRADEFDDITAELSFTMTSEDFDALVRPQSVVLELDLNISGGSGPTVFAEGFEGSGLGSFTTMSLDQSMASNTLSNGFRCQYNDPDFINSNSYGETQCYLGNSFHPIIPNTFDWHNHSGPQAPDGGRAYSGTQSLHFGVHTGTSADLDTTSLATLDAVRTNLPINMGYAALPGSGSPELSFKHQISHVDWRSTNTPFGEAVDRGVVHVQLADAFDAAVGDWVKLEPYQNVHDTQGTDNFVDCLFDPVDDGNNEDTFYDPTDPERRLGPSSTCFPEATFVFQGETEFRSNFNPLAVGNASDGPGLEGSVGPGTWVETRFDLSRFQGRRLRLRFLSTSIEVDDIPTYQSAFQWNPVPFDDGWYIDDVQISNTLTSAATVVADPATPTDPLVNGCPTPCGTVTADITATPAALDAPGQVVELSADQSSADRCVDGTLQFQFWIDENGNNVIDDPGDTLVRDWTDSPLLSTTPMTSTMYLAGVRCSSDPACGATDVPATDFVFVNVGCPSTGNLKSPFNQELLKDAAAGSFSWAVAEVVDVVRGNLTGAGSGAAANDLLGTGSFAGTVEACLADDMNINQFTDMTTPLGSGDGLYFLVRPKGGAACNESGSWNNGSSQVGDRDPDIDGSVNTCP